MVSEEIIRADILAIYKAMADALRRETSTISESTRIWEDLRFTVPIREAMSDPLSSYCSQYGAKRILRSEAKGFKKIKNAADKVLKNIKAAKEG
ncbi:MAG: hypothetical protein ISR69_14000 [Gammaproteobacteria bacterium]|nr:hypothetical protein [Gammaproteobacteria bacterium]